MFASTAWSTSFGAPHCVIRVTHVPGLNCRLCPWTVPKRPHTWVKYKVNEGQEFVIGGYTVGKPFDAVVVGYYDDGKLIYASKVRNGFVPHVRREVMERIENLETENCPFTNLPEKKRTQWALTKEEMKKCVWLRPEIVAQIEFTSWTPDGHLRHATFAGLREDKNAGEVVREPG